MEASITFKTKVRKMGTMGAVSLNPEREEIKIKMAA